MSRTKDVFVLFAKVAFVWLLFLISACGADDDTLTPKPRAYYRILFPEKEYKKYDSVCPFIFQIPNYAFVVDDKSSSAEPCWMNVVFPSLNGILHISYKKVNGNLNEYMSLTHELATKHQIKASRIAEELIRNDSSKVYGLLYDIGGNAASPINFFVTDSVNHFVRASFYFNAVPNIDSVAPAIAFVKKDIIHMIKTFHWKH